MLTSLSREGVHGCGVRCKVCGLDGRWDEGRYLQSATNRWCFRGATLRSRKRVRRHGWLGALRQRGASAFWQCCHDQYMGGFCSICRIRITIVTSISTIRVLVCIVDVVSKRPVVSSCDSPKPPIQPHPYAISKADSNHNKPQCTHFQLP